MICAPNFTTEEEDLNHEKLAAKVASSISLSLFNPLDPPRPNSVKNRLFASKKFPISFSEKTLLLCAYRSITPTASKAKRIKN